jgi:quercetin dioxygenase-like cupin family protein
MSIIINKLTDAPVVLETGRTRQWLANINLGSQNTSVLQNYFEIGGFVPAHFHEVEELLICLEGKGVVIADGVKYDFNQGDTAIIPPTVIHEVHNVGDSTMRMLGVFPSNQPKGTWIENDNIKINK